MTVLKRKKFKPLSTTNDKNPGGLNTTNEMNVHNEPGKGVEDRRRRVWVLDNPNFREFYSSQRIVSESEFEPLMKCLGRDLPITYRISCSCEYKCVLGVGGGKGLGVSRSEGLKCAMTGTTLICEFLLNDIIFRSEENNHYL